MTSGKLLGFMVSQRGIEVDLEKIKSIIEMKPPRTKKEIQGFLGKIQYISKFIAQLTMTCEPLFQLLKKEVPMVWNEQCQETFEKIKSYLMKPPILVPPLEKTCIALVWATRKLRHYMLAFKVMLIARMDPLKYLIEKPVQDGKTAK